MRTEPALRSWAAGARAHRQMSRHVVIDTNVWLDLFVFDDWAARPLAQALQSGALLPIRSEHTDAELQAVLARPLFAAKLSPGARAALINRWQALARCVAASHAAPWSCRDPHDQKFLDLAYSAQAQTLFTKDRALLRLARAARRNGLQIASPGAAVTAPPENGPSQGR